MVVRVRVRVGIISSICCSPYSNSNLNPTATTAMAVVAVVAFAILHFISVRVRVRVSALVLLLFILLHHILLFVAFLLCGWRSYSQYHCHFGYY